MTTHAGGLTCVLTIPTGEVCGITARDRCGRCHRAKCMQHTDSARINSVGGDCTECGLRERQQNLAARESAEALEQSQLRQLHALVDALVAAGSPGLESRKYRTGTRKRFLLPDVTTYLDLGPAWPVGVCSWEYRTSNSDVHDARRTADLETGITPGKELIWFDPKALYNFSGRPSIGPAWQSNRLVKVLRPGAGVLVHRLEAVARQHGVAIR